MRLRWEGAALGVTTENNSVSRLNAYAFCDGATDDIGDGLAALNACDADFTDEIGSAFDDEFGVRHSALAVSKADDNKIVFRVVSEHSAFGAALHNGSHAGLFRSLKRLHSGFGGLKPCCHGITQGFKLGDLGLHFVDLSGIGGRFRRGLFCGGNFGGYGFVQFLFQVGDLRVFVVESRFCSAGLVLGSLELILNLGFCGFRGSFLRLGLLKLCECIGGGRFLLLHLRFYGFELIACGFGFLAGSLDFASVHVTKACSPGSKENSENQKKFGHEREKRSVAEPERRTVRDSHICPCSALSSRVFCAVAEGKNGSIAQQRIVSSIVAAAPSLMRPPPMPHPQVVWFKRDLRVDDHAPLATAASSGAVICLYIYEDELLRSPEYDISHLVFLNEALADLERALAGRGGKLIRMRGAAVDTFTRLHRATGFRDLRSHEETGNALTYCRDLRVAAWCRENHVLWHESRQDGVVRRLKNRDGWARNWERMMRQAVMLPPERIDRDARADALDCGPVTAAQAGLDGGKPEAQKGGAAAAQRTLQSFLTERGVDYRKAMSSPVEGWTACSRLSPYFAFGCLSVRTAAQAAAARLEGVRRARADGAAVDVRWLGSLQSFAARLRWHCHFMQKLESESSIEFENFSRAFDGLREEFTDSPEGRLRFEAWCAGQTGYPMVDACMRCVQASGWLNFRMRAMLASFAAYHLWLHWRTPAVFLARHFLDFEPGIHFSQFQMQSGTTGINTLRIYSPAKQAREQDPRGVFIRRWLPELRDVPLEFLAEPHRMPGDMQRAAGCRIGSDYPEPIVDHAAAYREARRCIAEVRKRGDAKTEARRVYLKHGSRRRPGKPSRKETEARVDGRDLTCPLQDSQMELFKRPRQSG